MGDKLPIQWVRHDKTIGTDVDDEMLDSGEGRASLQDWQRGRGRGGAEKLGEKGSSSYLSSR